MSFEKKRKKKKSTMPVIMPSMDWEIEEDLRAVARAQAVEGDPERMKKVRAMAKKKLDESKERRKRRKS